MKTTLRSPLIFLLMLPLAALSATHEVDIVGFQFSPAALTIQVGDTVKWTQRDGSPHTSTSESNVWSSQLMTSPGATYSLTFDEEGEFPYYCTVHPEMLGSVTVEAAAGGEMSISITSPVSGSELAVPGTTSIEVAITGVEGAVAHVEFLDADVPIGVVTREPYSLLHTLGTGSHSLVAKVVDDSGAEALSAAVEVDVVTADRMSVGGPEFDESVLSPAVLIQLIDGDGPFLVQRSDNIADPVCGPWINSLPTGERSVGIEADYPGEFFRAVDLAGSEAIAFSAWISGEAERQNEPVDTDATGQGLFRIEGDLLTFNITYEGLSGVASAAHIHGPATSSESTGVMIDLAPFNGGEFGTAGSLSGQSVLTPGQKIAILSGRTYVNIHTAAYSAGEIRGQIAPVAMQARLSGTYERPDPVPGEACGLSNLLLVGNRLYFNTTYRNLSGPASAAHIHGPADTQTSTGVLVNLEPYNGGGFGVSGSLSGEIELTAGQLGNVIDGLTYINVHTGDHSAGEIRGQILPHITGKPFTASMSSSAEVSETPVESAGVGSGIFLLEGGTLHFSLRYEGLTGPASAAHIHGPAPASASTGVLINLEPFNGGAFGAEGFIAGSVALTEEQMQHIGSGRTYVNIHTSAFPAGEIRGQIAPVLMNVALNGVNERQAEPVVTTADGFGSLLLAGDDLYFNVRYEGLSVTASASHIHGPAEPSASAGVIIDLAPVNGGAFSASGSLSGLIPLSPEHVAYIVDGLTYINIHTSTHTAGEIRGQILP